jgi:hypothetical protein
MVESTARGWRHGHHVPDLARNQKGNQDRLVRIHAVVAVDDVSSNRTMCGMTVGTDLAAIEFAETKPLLRCDVCSDVIGSVAFIH